MSVASAVIEQIRNCDILPRSGKVLQFYGLAVEATGPSVFLGEICKIYASPNAVPVLAEVVGFREGRVLLMPQGSLKGISIGSEIIATGQFASIPVGDKLIGRIIDAFGNPLDGRPLDISGKQYPLYPEAINPLNRSTINLNFETGVKVIDSMLPIGRGQRMGLFAGSGVGKSNLLGMISRNSNADINVIALVGERGREVVEFVQEVLGEKGLAKSVVVVATADNHALVRTHAAYAATAIAEFFKDIGKHVMLAMDSVTRFAMAQREVGLAVGEPPTARGYTPSAFSALPKLIERAGNFSNKGSITAFYTVLVEGDDFNEPISDNLRAILDGHIILSRDIAAKNQFPAVDVLNSVSRLSRAVCISEEYDLIDKVRRLLSTHYESKDMIDIGAYEKGRNENLDKAINFVKRFDEFVKQKPNESKKRSESIDELKRIIRSV